MRHWKPRLILHAMLILLTGQSGFPQTEPPSADQRLRFQRLATLGKIWATIDHFHPFLAYRDIDWDAALLRAVPHATADRSGFEFAAAVQSMLSALEDGVTEVIPGRTENPAPTPEPVRWSVRFGGVLVISINDYRVLRNYDLARKQLYGLAEEIRKSRGVIFDLRPLISADFGGVAMRLSENGIDQALCSKELRLPSQRRRTYSGLPNPGNSRWYYGSFSTEDAGRVFPGRSGVAPRTAFIINSQSQLPPIALALQENGDARIVFDGAPNDAPAVKSREFLFAEGLRVRIRISELVYHDGTTGLAVDGRAEQRDPVLVALGLLEQPNRSRPKRPTLPAQGLLVRKDYGGPEFPSGPERLLAAFRVWAVFEYFFPHRDIMGEDWDRALIDAIARVEKARDAIEYVDAISRMTSLTHDTHVTVRSKAVGDYFDSSLPIRLRFVEGRPVIIQVATTAETGAIHIGDSLLAIDGVAVSALIEEARQKISSSTEQASLRYAMSRLTWAHGNETKRLSIQTANGEAHEHTVTTRPDYWDRQTSQPAGVAYRKLTPDIGYVDLGLLPVDQIEAMVQSLRETRGLIVDLRHGTQTLAAVLRLAKRTTIVERDRRPIVSLQEESDSQAQPTGGFLESTVTLEKPLEPYEGIVVGLIDEYCQSQLEHGAIGLKVAADAVLIGSATAGALWYANRFALPGNIQVTFSGGDARWPDGRRVQRVGVLPDIAVNATIDGIRTGRDEVLERAVEYLRSHK